MARPEVMQRSGMHLPRAADREEPTALVTKPWRVVVRPK